MVIWNEETEGLLICMIQERPEGCTAKPVQQRLSLCKLVQQNLKPHVTAVETVLLLVPRNHKFEGQFCGTIDLLGEYALKFRPLDKLL